MSREKKKRPLRGCSKRYRFHTHTPPSSPVAKVKAPTPAMPATYSRRETALQAGTEGRVEAVVEAEAVGEEDGEGEGEGGGLRGTVPCGKVSPTVSWMVADLGLVKGAPTYPR
jgi:hypothetical protein